METSFKPIFLLASALCSLSLGIVHAEDPQEFFVEGKVYCDNCHSQFVTRITKYMKVMYKGMIGVLRPEGGKLTFAVDSETNASGSYCLKLDGNHDEEAYEVALVESSDPECAEIDKENYLRKSARICLTKDNGMSSNSRVADPLGYMIKKSLPECIEVLRELGITSAGLL